MAASASHTPVLPGLPEPEQTPTMHVRKRNGALDSVDVNKIVRAVQRCAHDLQHVDVIRVASRTLGGLYDGATTRELDTTSIDTAASLIVEEPWFERYANILALWPTRACSGWASCLHFAAPTRFHLWSFRMCRNGPTFSSAASPHTRFPCPAKARSTRISSGRAGGETGTK